MSPDVFFTAHEPRTPSDDGITVRFPPGLGLIPPRDVPHPRIRGAGVTDVTG
jgi:hypothetical protein